MISSLHEEIPKSAVELSTEMSWLDQRARAFWLWLARTTVRALWWLTRKAPKATAWALYHFFKAVSRNAWTGLEIATDLRVIALVLATAFVGRELLPHSTTDALVHVVWTEARGESRLGQEAVVWTVYNRLAAQKPYWGMTDVVAVVYDRRGPKGVRCEYDGVCVEPSMRGVRYSARWFALALLVTEVRLKVALGWPDPTGGAHSYATHAAWQQSYYHRVQLCETVAIGEHRFGVDPETGECLSEHAPLIVTAPTPRAPVVEFVAR